MKLVTLKTQSHQEVVYLSFFSVATVVEMIFVYMSVVRLKIDVSGTVDDEAWRGPQTVRPDSERGFRPPIRRWRTL